MGPGIAARLIKDGLAELGMLALVPVVLIGLAAGIGRRNAELVADGPGPAHVRHCPLCHSPYIYPTEDDDEAAAPIVVTHRGGSGLR